MSVSVLVTVLGATVSAGAAAPVESWFSWRPPPLPVFATELVVVVVVVVVVVGAVVPFELQATDSRPTATATMPTVDGAPFADLRSTQRQRNLALIAKLRRDSEIHSYLYAGDR